MENLDEIKKQAEDNIKEVAMKSAQEVAVKAVNEVKETFVSKEDLEKHMSELKKADSENQAKIKELKQTSAIEKKSVSIFDSISMTIKENAETLKGVKDKTSIALKAIDDTSWAAGALARQTTNVRRDLYMSPYSPIYLRNIFPNVSTESASIVIPQVQAVTGAVVVYNRFTEDTGSTEQEKAEVTPTWKGLT